LILADTSVWVDYIRGAEPDFAALLSRDEVLVHQFVIGELAVGNLRDRENFLDLLHVITHSVTAADSEVLRFISRFRLCGLGIGYIDCHLLASVMLTPGVWLWTRDNRLHAVASRLGVAANFSGTSNGPY
jgi:predicted nucleic acid-binding protein